MQLGDPKLGSSVAGQYRLAERLGAGGMGVVYKGEDSRSGDVVAVKFLHEAFAGMPDLVRRFEREVAAMRCMSHPHLVAIVDSGVDGGVPFLVMEFQAGKALAEIIDRGALPPARAVGIARQVLAGVAAAHASGVVHRDLKPDNIMLLAGAKGDFVKILDFGLAKMVEGSNGTQLTNTGFALGTPGYMAPEQANGEQVDERADIYAVGVMMYHMVVGRKPFVADSPMAVLRMHMDDPPVPPRKAAPDAHLSAELEAVILRALEKDPAKRWSSAEAFARALESTAEGGASKIPLLEISMHEVGDSRTAVGRKGSAKARTRGPRVPWRQRFPFNLPFRWIARLTLVIAVAVAITLLWSRVWRPRRQMVMRQVDSAVDNAKQLVQRNHHEVAREVDDAVDTAKVALQRDRQKAQQRMDTAMETAKSALHSLTSSVPGAPHDTPGTRLEAAARAHPLATRQPLRLADAHRLLAAGKLDAAMQTLYQLRRHSPRNADVALLLGHAYFGKRWRNDGLREYDEALRLRPSLRGNAQLVRNVVAALDDPTFNQAAALVHARLGTAVLGELKRAGRAAKNPRVQKRAAHLAVELADAGRPHR
jgi:serine/threonine-protein kinase